MNRLIKFVAAATIVAGVSVAGIADAQDCPNGNCGGTVGGVISDDVTIDGSYVGDFEGVSGIPGQRRAFGQPDLFYNYYTQGNANTANAQMYLSPQPIPPNVGHTYYTYQPFYPHHMLYAHKDRYHNYYDNGRGMNRTRAIYYAPPIKTGLQNLYWNKIRIPR